MQSAPSRWRSTFAALNQSATWLGIGILLLVWSSMTFHLRHDLSVTRGNAAESAEGATRSVEAFSRHAVSEIDGMLLLSVIASNRRRSCFQNKKFAFSVLQVASIDAGKMLPEECCL